MTFPSTSGASLTTPKLKALIQSMLALELKDRPFIDQVIKEAQEESEVENQQLKVDFEDAIMAKEEVELAVEAGGQRGHGCRCCEEQGPRCGGDQDTG